MTDRSAPDAAGAFFASLADRTAVMGILNVTPDSFSGDGVHGSVAMAVDQARAMQGAGCHILDIGGESTRPGAAPLSLEDERSRLVPVLEAVRQAVSIPLSIDTYKAAIAKQAVGLGACIVNDVWGLQKDPGMADVVAHSGAGLVIMHNRTKADPDIDILQDIDQFFVRSLEIAGRAGIDPGLIALDPGIGFGKTIPQNFIILNHLERFVHHGKPLLIGLSRKRFIGEVLQKPVEERLIGTLASNLFACSKGAAVIRVHDVAEHVDALKMIAAIKGEPYG